MSRPSIHNLTICSPYLVGYETVAVGEMEDLVSDEDTDTGNIDEDTKESILAQAAAEAADAVAEEDAVPAETPERYTFHGTFRNASCLLIK